MIAASEVAKDDTPRRIFLKRGIRQLSSEVTIKNKKLKTLQQTVRRQLKKIADMKTIIKDLKNQNRISEDVGFNLFESFGKHQDLIKN